MENLNLYKLEEEELKLIDGGTWLGAVFGAAAVLVVAAHALGYYDGKADCPPPPCE